MNNLAQATEIALRQISSLFRHDKNQWAEPFGAAERHHRVYMSFARQAGGIWLCRFHKDDLTKTPISKRFSFRNASTIVEIVGRGRGFTGMESRQDLDGAVALGRGGIFLELDSNQLQALSRQS
jgi:hypothetical protein